ncbi:MAG: dienelactone hydrolase family protein [Candidatus Marinimicrobia bacterium]|nr:dienelactone hydrolase family protein [Candidatus Neomarinimicrobiota bacterium]MCF7828050.1 dienelactone hydrolase family protein [Candidatus Neomarinimicrobiota bacterium]MCF7879195.1 dienelactone hydrolase family protein [Candidatus Neomarinimicrobiota bacterium]
MISYRKLTGVITLLSIIFAGSLIAQSSPIERLNESPRHHEWVQVEHDNRTVHSFVVYPQADKNVPTVLLIHENRGLTDWVRGLADQVAAAGFIAIAPDLLSGMGPDGGKTSDYPNSNAARDGIYQLPPAQVTADLKAVADYGKNLSASNGTLFVAGFCWGGSQTFRFATNYGDIEAAFPFYGTAPEDMEQLKQIEALVYGFYGGNDNRVTSTVPQTKKKMKTAGKTYKPEVYKGAGHGFMRAGEGAPKDDPNRQARDKAWDRWIKIMKEEM